VLRRAANPPGDAGYQTVFDNAGATIFRRRQ
jgi:hypothetical protein